MHSNQACAVPEGHSTGPQGSPGVDVLPLATVAATATPHKLSIGELGGGQARMGRAGLEWGHGEERRLLSLPHFLLVSGPLSTVLTANHPSEALRLGTCMIFMKLCCLFIALSILPNLNCFASSDGCDHGASVDRSAQARQHQVCKPGILK